MENRLALSFERFPQTEYWMDSLRAEDIRFGIEHGNIGVTTSPVWASVDFCGDLKTQTPRILALCKKHPSFNEQEIFWAWAMETGRERSRLLLPLWEKGKPHKGRFGMQVSVYEYRNAQRMVDMALEIDSLGENMQAKIPATKAGILAMEEATYRGVSVMATLCYSVSQALGAAEAIMRGIARRQAEGLPVDMLNPACAVLLAMQEEWLAKYARLHDICIPADSFNHAASPIVKKIYQIFTERSYPVRLITAYYRTQQHWSEYIGGNIGMSIPASFQRFLATGDIEVKDYMSSPVNDEILRSLQRLEPFRQAYEEGALSADDFDSFGPVVLTLRYFTETYEKAILKIRDIMLPDPLV